MDIIKTVKKFISKKKQLLTILMAIVGIIIFFVPFPVSKKPIPHKKISLIKKEPWITIFIHGNFNTGLGMLSFTDVFKDNLKDTTYRKILKRIRKDPFFYQEQPMLEKGLVKIEPSFNLIDINNKFAAHPILSGYKKILETIRPNKEHSYFYTFGWSGLMSQTVRRKWAIRLYNALGEELEAFNKIGINPKIRIIAHSHGGNIGLNLAIINDVINNVSYEKETIEAKETFDSVTLLLKSATNKVDAKKLSGQKRFDYIPTKKNIFIDELILLGTPIQIENVHSFKSPIFKNIYNFYSEQDVVQALDFVSTKIRTSKQRIEDFSNDNIKQAKIMVDKNLKTKEQSSWWENIPLGRLFASGTKDPTHKDLWFLGWNPDYCQPNFPLNPLPLVILIPFLIDALKKTEVSDIDLNLRFFDDTLKICVINHNEVETKFSVQISIKIINEIKAKTMMWKPDNLNRENTFKKMYAQLG